MHFAVTQARSEHLLIKRECTSDGFLGVWGERAWAGGLTVDGVVSYCTLGGLTGHVHDGPWGSPRDQVPGHNLESQREASEAN